MLNRILNSVNWRLTNAWKAKLVVSHLTMPIASFTFDDFPRSAWLKGGDILEQLGVRGTYFVAGVFAPENMRLNTTTDTIDGVEYYQLEDIRSVHEHGHEIGCHTFDHINVPSQSTAALTDNLLRNSHFISNLLGDVKMTSFAYPRGEANISTKTMLSHRFAVCRGTWPGVNTGLIDLSQLRCYSLDAKFRPDGLSAIINEAKQKSGWAIFNTHDVSDSPSAYGCTPEQLRTTVQTALDAGFVVLPIKNALGRMAFKN